MTEREKETGIKLQGIAKHIEKELPEGMGFTLLTYEFGEGDNRLLYVSNSKREDVMNAMIEFVHKNLNNPDMFGKDV